MEFVGKINKKAERTGTTQDGRAWKSAQYLVTEVKENPQSIVIDVMDGKEERVAQFDAMEGKVVKVRYGTHARLYNGRYYNDVTGYSVTEL